MTRYILARSLQSLALLIGALCIVFFMVRLTGDPVALMLPKDATNETRNEFRTAMGLDRPLPVQFLEYITRAARGDLGQSLSQRLPNLELIAQRLPATLELAFASLALALVLAVPLGLMAGLKPGSLTDVLAQTVAFTGQVIPGFWLAMILILTFAVQLRWLPSFGRDSLASLVLPSIALGFSSFGQLLRLVRASVLEVRGADFVRTAKAKGLVPWLIAARHVLPNVLIPLLSVAGIQFTYLLGGSVYIETIFAWPGLGSLLSSAIQDSDSPLVQAITILISVFAIGVQLLTDTLYALVDPRVQHEGKIWMKNMVEARAQILLSKRFRHVGGLIGALILVMLLIAAVFAPIVGLHPPNDGDFASAKLPPAWLEGGSWLHPFGTDQLGQDVWSRIIFGARVSLTVGFLGALLASLLGATLGLLAGFYGGWIDSIITAASSLILSIPYLILVVVLATVFGRNLTNVILLFGITDAPVFIRLVRGEVLRLKSLPFLEAAQSLGSSDARILWRHLLPNLLGPLVTLTTFETSAMIFYEAGLGFLGLSVPPAIPSWGNMLALGRQFLTVYPWMSIFPGLAIAVTGLGMNLVGEWVRAAFDPRSRP